MCVLDYCHLQRLFSLCFGLTSVACWHYKIHKMILVLQKHHELLEHILLGLEINGVSITLQTFASHSFSVAFHMHWFIEWCLLYSWQMGRRLSSRTHLPLPLVLTAQTLINLWFTDGSMLGIDNCTICTIQDPCGNTSFTKSSWV